MTSDQYIESVKQMMSQQNVYFGVFLAILAIFLGFMGVLQWKLSSKQVDEIKRKSVDSALTEMEDRLVKEFNVKKISELDEHKILVSEQIKELNMKSTRIEELTKLNGRLSQQIDDQKESIIKLQEEIASIKMNEATRNMASIIMDLDKIDTNEDILKNMFIICHKYISYLIETPAAVKFYIERVEKWLLPNLDEEKEENKEIWIKPMISNLESIRKAMEDQQIIDRISTIINSLSSPSISES